MFSFFYYKIIAVHPFCRNNSQKPESAFQKSTLLSRAIWKPANSLKFMSIRRRGPSPVIPCSSCLQSRRWAKERETVWFFTLMPGSCGAFFPTDTMRRSDSIFALRATGMLFRAQTHNAFWGTSLLR